MLYPSNKLLNNLLLGYNLNSDFRVINTFNVLTPENLKRIDSKVKRLEDALNTLKIMVSCLDDKSQLELTQKSLEDILGRVNLKVQRGQGSNNILNRVFNLEVENEIEEELIQTNLIDTLNGVLISDDSVRDDLDSFEEIGSRSDVGDDSHFEVTQMVVREKEEDSVIDDLNSFEEIGSDIGDDESQLELSQTGLNDNRNDRLFELKKLAWNSKIMVRHCVKELYAEIKQSCSIGGNGSGGAIYGEMTLGAFQKIVDYMKKHLGFSKESKFLDIGSGVGKPTLHVSQDPGVSLSMGIELKKERCYLSQHVLRSLLQNKKEKDLHIKNLSKCWFEQGDVCVLESLIPFTHIYSFDIGWRDDEYKRVAILFNISPTCIYYICYKTEDEMEYYGFEVELLYTMHGMSQHGSGSKGYPCYFYKKKLRKRLKRKSSAVQIGKDKRAKNKFEEREAFLLSSSIETKVDNLHQHLDETESKMATPRKGRNRKCCKCFILRDICPCPKY